MFSTMLRFPNAIAMTKFLFNHASLSHNYYQNKGITQAIADLASERLAGCNQTENSMKAEAALIVYDLQRGKNGITGTKLIEISLSHQCLSQLSGNIEKALIDCARAYAVQRG